MPATARATTPPASRPSTGTSRSRRTAGLPRGAVLALLVLQRLERQARERLGVRPGPVPCVLGRRGTGQGGRRASGTPSTPVARSRTGRRTSCSATGPTRSSTRPSARTRATCSRPCSSAEVPRRASAATTPRLPRSVCSRGWCCSPTGRPALTIRSPGWRSTAGGASGRRRPTTGPLVRCPSPGGRRPWTGRRDCGTPRSSYPGGSAAPPPVIETFCTVVGKGSVLFINFMANPQKVLFFLAVLALVLWFLLRRTSWRRVPPLPVVARRRAGEITRASLTLYGERPVTFAALGLIAVPVAVLSALVTAVLDHLPGVGDASTVADDGGSGSRLLLSAAVAAAFWPLTVLLVSAGRRVGRAHGPSGRVTATGRPRGRRTRQGPGLVFRPRHGRDLGALPDGRPCAGRRMAHGALRVPRSGDDARRPERPGSATAQRWPGPAPVGPHRGHHRASSGSSSTLPRHWSGSCSW
jgi:hypothetical protein